MGVDVEEGMLQSDIYSVPLLLMHDKIAGWKLICNFAHKDGYSYIFILNSQFKSLNQRQFFNPDEPSEVTVLLVPSIGLTWGVISLPT